MIKTVGEIKQKLMEQNMFHWLGDRVAYVAYDSDHNVSPIFKDACDFKMSVDFLLSTGCDYLWIFKADGTFVVCYDKNHKVVSVDFEGIKDVVDYDYKMVEDSLNNEFTLDALATMFTLPGDQILVPVISNGRIEGLERIGGAQC